MSYSFPINAPIGLWWQVRTFELHEHIEKKGWMRHNRSLEPKGIALFQHVLKGKMMYRDSTGTREVLPGWTMLCSTGEDSSYGFAADIHEPLDTFWISFSGAGVAEHWNDIRARFGSVVQTGNRSSVLDHARALCRRERPRTTAQSVQRASDVHSFFRHLYAFLESASHNDRSAVERALDEFASCSDGHLSVKEVAARHGISREHLTRVFSERQGMPPARYVARAKLARATTLLAETQLPIAKVALQCGFGSKQSLIRWMKREAGCLPNEIRRAQRKVDNRMG